MTPAQQQAAKIKELAEQYADAFADAKNSPWSGRLAALNKAIQEELHTAIDEVCSEAEKLRGEVAALSKDADRLDWIDKRAIVSLSGKQFSVNVNCYHGDRATRTLRTIIDAAREPQADKAKRESALQALADEGRDRGEWEVVK